MSNQDVVEYAKQILSKYALNYWKVAITKTRGHFGRCCYTSNTIEISKYHSMLNTEYEVKRTVLHEIAHALNPKCGHNSRWKRKFEELILNELGIKETIKRRYGKGKLPTLKEQHQLDAGEYKFILNVDLPKPVINQVAIDFNNFVDNLGK